MDAYTNFGARMGRLLPAGLLLAGMLSGCTTLQSDFETPSVELLAVRALPADGIAPQFEIDLRVLNPNRTDLRLKGASYSISIEDFELVKGVAANLPVVPAYGEARFKLKAGMSWMQGIKFLTTMANEPRDTVSYEMKAKLDMGALSPAIRVTEAGEISLDNLKSAGKR